MEKIARDIAITEVTSWLDYKKVNEKKRETYKESIDTLVDSVVDGSLSLSDDKVFVHTLKFPIGKEVSIPALEYKPRLQLAAVHSQLKNVKGDDADGRIVAYVAALTGQPKEVIKNLDTEDYSTAQAIAIFFL
jgi:hypothetical protein